MYKAIYGIFICCFLSFTLSAQESTTGLNEQGLPLSKRLTTFPNSEKAIENKEHFDKWLNSEKNKLGFSENAELEITALASLSKEVQLYSIEQSINNTPIYAHKSKIVIENGQPSFALTTASDLPAEKKLLDSEISGIVQRFLREKNLSSKNELETQQVYWKTETKLIPAIIIRGHLLLNNEPSGYDYIIDSATNILTKIAKIHDINYGVIDVDLMCDRLSLSQPFNSSDLISISFSEYMPRFTIAESIEMANSPSERKLAQWLEYSSEFMQDALSLSDLSERNAITVLAYTGTNYDNGYGLNCSLNGNSNAFWSTKSDQAGMLQVHSEFMNNPEVIMHELGHGIVSFSSDLIYQGQSGALNEAYADAVGVSFSSWLSNKMDSPSASHWRLHKGKTVFRDFADPHHSKKPDHYQERYKGADDHGGVHINSSIINHAFYLLSEGGKHRRLGGVSVPKIGMQKTLKIWNYGTTKLLTPTANFRDARFSFAKAAELIYGKYSTERTAIHKAFDALGVPGTWKVNKQPKPQEKKLPPKTEPKQQPKPLPQEKQKTPPNEKPKTTPKVPPQSDLHSSSKLLYVGAIALILLFFVFQIIKRSRPGIKKEEKYSAYKHTQEVKNDLKPCKNMVKDIYLYFHAGEEVFTLYRDDIEGKGVFIGRSEKATVTLASKSISSFHVKIFKENNRLYIEDVGSSYGTFINNRKLSKHTPLHIDKEQRLLLSDFSCVLSRSKVIKKVTQVSQITLEGRGLKFTISNELVPDSGISIGRDNDNEIVIDDPSVSGAHGLLKYSNNEWLYIDTNSTYGSLIKFEDKKQILKVGKAYALKSDSVVYLADYKMSCTLS